jgi:hypothetical protein
VGEVRLRKVRFDLFVFCLGWLVAGLDSEEGLLFGVVLGEAEWERTDGGSGGRAGGGILAMERCV